MVRASHPDNSGSVPIETYTSQLTVAWGKYIAKTTHVLWEKFGLLGKDF